MSDFLAGPDHPPHPPRAATHLGLATALIVGMTTTGFSQERGAASRDAPVRPVAVWPAGPLAVIAAFDRPIEPDVAKAMIGRMIRYGDPRTGGPGPKSTVAKQAGDLRIAAARLIDDGRTLVLATDPLPRVARYVLPLPGATTSYDLTGIEATWSGTGDPAAGPKWSGWWPSIDLDTTRRLTRGSHSHETGLALLSRPGRLLLSTWVRLPPGKVALRVDSSWAIEEFMLGDAQFAKPAREQEDGDHRAELAVESRGEPLFLTLGVPTGAGGHPLSLRASYRPPGEPADRPLERERLLVPWAPISTDSAIAPPLLVPDLSGGDPVRGRTIFRGDQARCAQCHVFRGEGGTVGPDLTGIASKGRAEIYRSLAAPSAAIEPEYTTYTVATRDGQVLSGVVRAEGSDELRITDTNARAVKVRRDQIQELRPSATSIMPPGLAAALGDPAVRDLIAYLTSPAETGTRPSP
jgi:putative heme-binding domain-containing protein